MHSICKVLDTSHAMPYDLNHLRRVNVPYVQLYVDSTLSQGRKVSGESRSLLVKVH